LAVEASMSDPDAPAPKKRTRKKAKAPTTAEKAERGGVLVVIGKADKLKSAPGVNVWHLEGEEVTEGGDRYAVAYLSTAEMYDRGWVRKK